MTTLDSAADVNGAFAAHRPGAPARAGIAIVVLGGACLPEAAGPIGADCRLSPARPSFERHPADRLASRPGGAR